MVYPSVLVVDDDDHIREILKLYFTKENFRVFEAADGVEAIMQIQKLHPDIMILDLMLPFIEGLEVCRRVKAMVKIPIIALTARSEDEDRLIGFEAGVDDYVTKPFSPKEVVTRAKAILRRVAVSAAHDKLTYDNLVIDRCTYTVLIAKKPVGLTSTEMELLWLLASHPERVYSREILLDQVWGYPDSSDTRTVDVHMQRLRSKIHSHAPVNWDIKTVWGVGYKFTVLR